MYICPMHPEIRQATIGLCPECGMSLIMEKTKHSSKEHDKHAGHHSEDFLKKFWVALTLTVPIFFYSELAQALFGLRGPQFPGWQWVVLAAGSAVFFYGGGVFLASANRELRARLPGMMTLIAIAISAAYLYSVFSLLFATGHDLWFELASLIAIMLIGHWVEMRAVQGTQGALKELTKLIPDSAEVVHGSDTITVPVSQLQIGSIVIIRPGAKIPADARIIAGESEVNEAMVTGEAKPVRKIVGDNVIAGTVNGDGFFRAAVTQIGEHTFLAGVVRLVKEAQASKSRLQLLSDRAALWLTFAALAVGGAAFAFWLVATGTATAFERLVAVLVIACPHALGLAVPLVASISTTLAARNGFLIKQRLALESARTVTTVFFDKTGTLTAGIFQVTAASSDETLRLAAAVDSHSEHPIAKAIVQAARGRRLDIPSATDYRRLPGVGGQASVNGREVFVGQRGGADIVVEAAGQTVGTITVADAPRPEAKEAITALKRLGIKTVMLTGDAQDVAAVVANELGITEYFARVLPGEKSEKIKLAQLHGQRVAMVGDGINDAPALARADVGIAIGAGTNVAIESAGIILVRNDPRDVAKVIKLSHLTYRKMIQNLWWAAGYNIVAIPLAAGVLASRGILLQPAVAAVLMSLSTVIVAINAMLLRQALR